MTRRVVIALGGNAMTGPDGSATPGAQRDAIARGRRATSPTSSPPASRSCSPTATARRWATCWSRTSWPRTSSRRCRWTGASPRPRRPSPSPSPTSWTPRWQPAGVAQRTVGLVTRTLVDADDPDFREPSKPVGRFVPQGGGRAVHRPRPDLGGPRREGLAPGRRLARAALRRRRPRHPRAGRRRLRRRLRRRRRHPGRRRRAGRRTRCAASRRSSTRTSPPRSSPARWTPTPWSSPPTSRT